MEEFKLSVTINTNDLHCTKEDVLSALNKGIRYGLDVRGIAAPLDVEVQHIPENNIDESNLDNKLLNDLLNLRTYSTFPNVIANYMGVEMEYDGRIKDVSVSNEVVKAADIKAIIEKYIRVLAKETKVIIPSKSVVVEIDETIPFANAHIDRLTDVVTRKIGHDAIYKAYVVIAVDSVGTGVVIKNVGKGVERFFCPQRGIVIPNIKVNKQYV